MISRPMRHDRHEVRQIRDLFRACHPGWPVPEPEWWIAHPTLVIEGIIEPRGYTSFSVAPALANGLPEMVMYGADVCVRPGERGHGLASILHHERCIVARAAGAVIFVGGTQPDNVAMRRIFEKSGATAGDVIAKYYPDGSDAVLYTAVLGGT